ncbi:MAG: hypothetical protein KKD77_21995 [Gammaproteobacteria bacterium]|nr:hypothetical protein [Gammaproteobacteria bacterium]MBU2685929.1 hypothetical protein [Gammaproteobacteria bacterium]
MKINLTKLLEIPLRVTRNSQNIASIHTTDGSHIVYSEGRTSPDLAYFFELEKENKNTGIR